MRNKKWQWELKRQWELITILLKLKKLNECIITSEEDFYDRNGIEELYEIDDAEY